MDDPPQAVPPAAYIHVPFCARRCGYCNFTVIAGRDDWIGRYLGALERELGWLETPRPVETVFLGGGTPTHLAVDQLARLLALAGRWFPLEPGGEYSAEANPSDLTAEKLARLGAAGVNRISIGGQSFDAKKLRTLERDHSPRDLVRSVEAARKTFPSVSLDLIFGVPGEAFTMWERDLKMAIDAGVDHISVYGLTIEKGSAFFGRALRGALAPVGESLEVDMYEAARETLTAAGFEHYEISNYAHPGYRCRHNEVYWLGEPYYAAGPGATRYLGGRREMNHRSVTTYLRRVLAGISPVAEIDEAPPEERARERLAFGLRMLDGMDESWFVEKTGKTVDEVAGGALDELITLGLLYRRDGRVRLTRRGVLLADSVMGRILRDDTESARRRSVARQAPRRSVAG